MLLAVKFVDTECIAVLLDYNLLLLFTFFVGVLWKKVYVGFWDSSEVCAIKCKYTHLVQTTAVSSKPAIVV